MSRRRRRLGRWAIRVALATLPGVYRRPDANTFLSCLHDRRVKPGVDGRLVRRRRRRPPGYQHLRREAIQWQMGGQRETGAREGHHYLESGAFPRTRPAALVSLQIRNQPARVECRTARQPGRWAQVEPGRAPAGGPDRLRTRGMEIMCHVPQIDEHLARGLVTVCGVLRRQFSTAKPNAAGSMELCREGGGTSADRAFEIVAASVVLRKGWTPLPFHIAPGSGHRCQRSGRPPSNCSEAM